MRYMVFMISEVYQPKNGTDPDFVPDAEMLAKMGRTRKVRRKN